MSAVSSAPPRPAPGGSSASNGTERRSWPQLVFGVVKFLGCVAWIYGAYVRQGQVSPLLAKALHGEERAPFPHPESSIGFQCIACFVWAAFLWLLLEARSKRKFPPAWKYATIGITNVIGPSCGMIALKNISYPAQVLAKSCKSVPIMLSGALLYGKRYSSLEYLSASAIGVGVGMFAMLTSKKPGALHDSNPMLGYSLVIVNLVFDALTNSGQDDLNRQYPENTSLHMMCWTNFWGALYYALYLFVFSGSGAKVVSFCIAHPTAMWHLVEFCLCGALGQVAIFYTISAFGSLICSIVCTTRKFFSILLNVLHPVTGAPMSAGQWGAVAMVFTGMLYKSFIRLFPKKVKQT